jgi:hypothetical protein
MQDTKYEQFIDEMEKRGFKKERSVINEIYAKLSEDDEIISIAAHDCHMITIKGIRESTRSDRQVTPLHHIYMEIYDYHREKMNDNDTVQFAIAEFRNKGLPTMEPDIHRCIYYQYPYKTVALGAKFKKGIAITKDKILEIKIIRSSKPMKIGRFSMELECDKWFSIDEERNNRSIYVTKNRR